MPASELGENCSYINRTHGNPHQQSADLLISITRQAPITTNRAEHSQSIDRVLVNRTNRNWRKGQDNAEHAAGSAGGKEVNNPRGRRKPLLLARAQGPATKTRFPLTEAKLFESPRQSSTWPPRYKVSARATATSHQLRQPIRSVDE